MRITRFILTVGLAVAAPFIAQAQPEKTTPAPTPLPMTVKRVEVYITGEKEWCGAPTTASTPAPTPANQPEKPAPAPTPPCKAGIGDTIIVTVENLSSDVNPANLLLYIDGRPLKGLNSYWWNPPANQIAFDLKRTDDSSAVWSALLSKPGFNPFRMEHISVGTTEKPFATDKTQPPTILLRVYHRGWAIFSFILLILTLGLFVFLAKRTGIIRDPGPPKAATTERPYSLARAQAAVWFFLVIASFVLIYVITGDYNTITEQALILMGIGTGTALGSAMIDANKSQSANDALGTLNPQQAQLTEELKQLTAQRDQLQTQITNAGGAATAQDKQTLSDLNVQISQKQATLTEINKQITDASSGLSKPTSEGFGRDMLTDVNGINFHRFQMVVWTVVVGFLFCAGVYSTLAMPQFSGTLLALMGISAGTYLGFKIPEKQN